jgi:hypothetical protein
VIHIPAEERRQPTLLEDEEMSVEQTMPGLMRKRGRSSTLGSLAPILHKSPRDEDALDAARTEFGVPEDAIAQVAVLRGNFEPLFNEAFDTDSLRSLRVRPGLAELVGANFFDFLRRIVNGLAYRPGVCSVGMH